ncbi:MAG: hypothetical protein WC719_01950 [Patescibacteria group bacterium]|jgi:(p)ppGpp synthase/HD superfamily hydrolase
MSFELRTNNQEVSARREKIEQDIEVFRAKIAEKFSGESLAKIAEALDFMLKIHLPQADRADGRPFASHPLAVAEKVMELSDNPELTIAALIHDGVEDQADRIFVERNNRKYPHRKSVPLDINENLKEKYKNTLRNRSFKEIKDRFGDKVEYYIQNMTNHDYNSLAEDANLTGEEKQDFINDHYAEHVEEIMGDPELFTLKLADLSVNIDLHSMDSQSEKHVKLKRKYKSVIEAVLARLKTLEPDHLLYSKKDEIAAELTKIYQEQYE